jgi:RND family efflux transporter MFP subunit
VARLQNLQETFALGLEESDIELAQQIIDQHQITILALMALIESSSIIPQEINQAMWAETSAQKALEDAQTKLRELQHPDQNSVALARYRVDAAQATLDGAIAELGSLQDPTPADLAAARAEVTEAEQALLVTQDDHVRHDIAAAQALVAQAQAQVDLVEQQLLDSQIHAPFDGLVTRRWLSPGAVVSPQTAIVTVSSRDLVVSVEVEEASVNSLQPGGQPVIFTTPVLPGRQMELLVDWVAPSGNRQARTFSVQLSPVELPQGLRPGMSGDVSIDTSDTPGQEVVLVPRQAILYREEEATLFVVQDGRAYLRKVTTGRENINDIEVRSGLQPGEQVVVSGRESLQDGDPVALDGISKLPTCGAAPGAFLYQLVQKPAYPNQRPSTDSGRTVSPVRGESA